MLGKGREKGRKEVPRRLCATSTELDKGLNLLNCEDHDLHRDQKSNAQLTRPLKAPLFYIFKRSSLKGKMLPRISRSTLSEGRCQLKESQ